MKIDLSLVMQQHLHRRLVCKWFLLFILSVLVQPELLDTTTGPDNQDSCHLRKRKIVGYCRKCDFRAETEVMSYILIISILIIKQSNITK